MEISKDILQEIESDSNMLLEELSLYTEEQIMDKPNNSVEQENRKKSILNKSNDLLKKMKKNLNDEDYLINGFGYHSQILYKMCTKFPFLGKTIGVPLMAITKAATNNSITRKMEQEKILNLYTRLKGDQAAVNEKISKLEKLEKPNKDQKEELTLLKKMSSELGTNMKRLELNYNLSRLDDEKAKQGKKVKNYTF